MAARGLEGALRCRQCIQRATRNSQRRTFTSSPPHQKHGALPTFTPTSSPELDTILSTFRSKVFVPSHLLKRHRDLVYRKRHHPVLASEPVTVTIGDEEILLEPLDRLVDEPSMRDSFRSLLDLMKEPRDWDNLPEFLAALHTAKRRLKPWQMEKMVRRANEMGRQGAIMECLRRSATTGFLLGNVRIVREVMWGARQKAEQAEWSEDGTKKAFLQAEQIMELLNDPKHTFKKAIEGEHPNKLPEIVGVVLELAAATAVKHKNGKDEYGKVAAYATTTLQSLQRRANLDFDPSNMHDANYTLQMWAPVLHGLNLAAGVIKTQPKLTQDIKFSTQKLEAVVSKARETLLAHTPQDVTRRGLKIYDAIPAVMKPS